MILFDCQNKETKTVITSVNRDAPDLENIDKYSPQIYGWYPYWMKDSYENLNYKLLTTVSFYSVDVYLDSNNSISFKDKMDETR